MNERELILKGYRWRLDLDVTQGEPLYVKDLKTVTAAIRHYGKVTVTDLVKTWELVDLLDTDNEEKEKD